MTTAWNAYHALERIAAENYLDEDQLEALDCCLNALRHRARGCDATFVGEQLAFLAPGIPPDCAFSDSSSDADEITDSLKQVVVTEVTPGNG